MNKAQEVDNYISMVISHGLYSTKAKLRFHLETLFKGIDLDNKSVLDIGCGNGLYSFYAASRGAEKVVCLEPASDGSTSKEMEDFHKLNKLLTLKNVELELITLQEFDHGTESFDVILLNNSINHLNETACINLLKESKYKAIYKEIFTKIYSLSNKGAKLIICDCTRYNFFGLLNIRNPFFPDIEWYKHQSPKTWAKLLSEVGFVNPQIRWSSFNAFGDLGKVLLSNKIAAYFLRSHFCITMNKP